MSSIINDLIPFAAFAVPILIIWIVFRYIAREREMINRERMALIEKGVYDFPMDAVKKGINLHRYLFWGFTLTGLGVGIIIAGILLSVSEGKIEEGPIVSGVIFLFTGLGILLFYKIQSKKEKEKANSQPEQLTE